MVYWHRSGRRDAGGGSGGVGDDRDGWYYLHVRRRRMYLCAIVRACVFVWVCVRLCAKHIFWSLSRGGGKLGARIAMETGQWTCLPPSPSPKTPSSLPSSKEPPLPSPSPPPTWRRVRISSACRATPPFLNFLRFVFHRIFCFLLVRRKYFTRFSSCMPLACGNRAFKHKYTSQ